MYHEISRCRICGCPELIPIIDLGNELGQTLDASRAAGKLTLELGASTKGKDIPAIGEVNPDKFGRLTPGTLIPIISGAGVRARKPANLLELPWRFRPTFLSREQPFLKSVGRLLLPLPVMAFVEHHEIPS